MASFDVIFIGGGPAGYVGAIRCAQLGLSVAVVERDGLGGTCVLWGCIPAKALLEAASLANRVRHAADFGVLVGDVKTDYAPAMKRSRAVSLQNSKGVEFLFKKNKITYIKGTAKLAGKNSVAVKTADGKDETHDAVVVSTGSRVKGLPQAGLELNKSTIISSDEALILEKTPKSIIIVGAGAVGCEFADVFNAFGSAVTLIDVMPTILPLEDADSSKEVERSFKKRGITVLTGAKISNVKAAKDSVSMTVDAGGEKKELKADVVLVAAGRAPNVEEVGLKEAGVQLTERGFIKINEKMETTAKGIYAIGDVAGPPMLAHKGEHEGAVFAELLVGKSTHGMDYNNIPNVLPSGGGLDRAHRAAVQGQEARLQGRQVPLLSEWTRAHVGRDRGLRENHSRRQVRRDSRRAHRRRPRDRADPRASRRAGERVHR
jgi:dihydrolipoamide dehydrogenase